MDTKKVVGGVLALAIVAFGGYMVLGKKNTATSTQPVATTVESVANVNGVEITQTDFDSQLAASITALKNQGVDVSASTTVQAIRAQVLNDLINNELVNQGVKAAGIAATQQEVDAQFQAIINQLGGTDKLAEQLKQANLTEAKLKLNIAKQIAAQKFLLSNINASSTEVSDAEIKKFYDDAVKAQTEANKKLPKDQKPQPIPALKDVKAQIQQQLVLQKQQTQAAAFVQALRAKAKVETTLK
jgi:uncharacterized protein with von Willebrand factor type A (vWA) domain